MIIQFVTMEISSILNKINFSRLEEAGERQAKKQRTREEEYVQFPDSLKGQEESGRIREVLVFRKESAVWGEDKHLSALGRMLQERRHLRHVSVHTDGWLRGVIVVIEVMCKW